MSIIDGFKTIIDDSLFFDSFQEEYGKILEFQIVLTLANASLTRYNSCNFYGILRKYTSIDPTGRQKRLPCGIQV
jgi:hypothetical protein